MLAHSKNVSSNRLLIEFKNSNPAQNYISHNNTINIYKHNKTESFSLIRLKHLVSIRNFLTTTDARVNNNNINILTVPNHDPHQETIKTILYIPSELLDISIIQPYNNMSAYITNNSINNYKYCIPITHNDDVNITSYIPSSNMEHLIYDLQYILFMQNTFIPYHDMKYDKRIFRLLYFIKINSHFYLKSYIENDNVIKTLYINNYAIINDLINSYNITEHNNIYKLTKHNNDIILNRLFTNYTIDNINSDLFIYDILNVNKQYENLKEFYIFVVLFSELIINDTNDNKIVLYNICKTNLNKYKIINNFIIQNDINGYYTDFTQKFILFIKTIKDKINIINAHSLFTILN